MSNDNDTISKDTERLIKELYFCARAADSCDGCPYRNTPESCPFPTFTYRVMRLGIDVSGKE